MLVGSVPLYRPARWWLLVGAVAVGWLIDATVLLDVLLAGVAEAPVPEPVFTAPFRWLAPAAA